MNLLRSSYLGLSVLTALSCAVARLALADTSYTLGPVDNVLLSNPLQGTSVQYANAMTSGDFNDDGIADRAFGRLQSSMVRCLAR